MLYYNLNGEKIFLNDKPKSNGAEAFIYEVIGRRYSIAKIFMEGTKDIKNKYEKIAYMIKNFPQGSSQNPLYINNKKIITIAWPTDMLFDSKGDFKGYLMPKIEYILNIRNFSIPQRRKKVFGKELSLKQIIIVAKNLAYIFDCLHHDNCIVCDANMENFLVSREGYVTLIDTDSFQITKKNGQIMDSTCFTPENSPYEYIKKSPIKFTCEGDRFILAVIIFKLLMDGFHPFIGKPLNTKCDTQDMEQRCIQNGWFPYESNPYIAPHPLAPNYINNKQLQLLFHKCFVEGNKNPNIRPTAKEWSENLNRIANENTMLQHSYKNKVLLNNNIIVSEKICPFILIMDVTPSIERFLTSLQKGYISMIEQLQASENSDFIDFCLIEFAEPPEVVISFKNIKEIPAHKIKIRGNYTYIGKALNIGFNELEKRCDYYKTESISYYKPKIILMTDGSFGTGDILEEVPRAIKRSKFYDVFCVVIGDVQHIKQNHKKILKEISTINSIFELKNDFDFQKFFNWVSLSVSTVNKKNK